MLHIIVGATGAGKTTFVQRLGRQCNAIVFTSDDWLNALFMPDLPAHDGWNWALARVERCEAQIWRLARELLGRGVEVVLDINMMNRATRQKQRQLASASGHPYKLYFLDVDRETRWQRVSQRNETKGQTYSFPISRAFFDFVEGILERPSDEELRDMVVVRGDGTIKRDAAVSGAD